MADTTITPPIDTGTPTNTGSSSGTPATIVTSNLSKTNYTNNVNSLNQANTALKNTAPNNPSVVDWLNLNNQPADYASRAKLAASQGITNYTGSESQNTQILNTLRSGTTGSNNNVDASGGGGTGMNGNSNNGSAPKPDANAPKVISTTSNSDGSSTAINDDGTAVLKYSDGQTYTIPKGMDVSLAKLGYDNIRAETKAADDAKAAMTRYANYNVDTDPAAVAAAKNIKDSYDVLIKQMQDKNAMLQGSYAKNSARSGMMQYANEMDSNFKSMELDKAVQRVTDLMGKRDAAIAKSNEAYRSGNLKLLDAAQKEYNQSIKDSNTAINTLQDNINAVIKTNDAQLKQAAVEARNQTLDSFKASTAVARDVATQLAGVTDPKQIDVIVAGMADKLGITDPSILKSAVEREQAKMATEDVNLAQKTKNLNKVVIPKGKGTYASFSSKPTSANISKVNAYISSIGGNQAAIEAANKDESLFYKTLNAIPKKGATGFGGGTIKP